MIRYLIEFILYWKIGDIYRQKTIASLDEH